MEDVAADADEDTARGRVTVPLLDTRVVDEQDHVVHDRVDLANGMVLAPLNDIESARVANALGERFGPQWRLEVHGVHIRPPSRTDPWPDNGDIGRLIRRLMAQLCCVIRCAPRWPTVVIDQWNGSEWERLLWVAGWAGGAQPGVHASLGTDRLANWGKLVTAWPLTEQDCPVELALDFFYESVCDACSDHNDRALILGAIAQEVLLGYGLQGEFRHRLSQRGALLVERDERATTIFDFLKRSYNERSRLVHAGERANTATVRRLHQFLMRAIPSMAALCKWTRSHGAAIEVLDHAPWTRGSALEALFEDTQGWWANVNVHEAVMAER